MYRLSLSLFLFLTFTGLCAAQSTALLTGTVNDPSGAVVQGAAVVCRNTETDMRSSMLTNAKWWWKHFVVGRAASFVAKTP